MKSKFLGMTIALSLLISPIHAQEVMAGEQKQSYEQAIDTAIKRLKKFKECVKGKEPCNVADFAALAAILLFIYGAVMRIRQSTLSGPTIKKTQYVNPVHWGYHATEKVIEAPGKAKAWWKSGQ